MYQYKDLVVSGTSSSSQTMNQSGSEELQEKSSATVSRSIRDIQGRFMKNHNHNSVQRQTSTGSAGARIGRVRSGKLPRPVVAPEGAGKNWLLLCETSGPGNAIYFVFSVRLLPDFPASGDLWAPMALKAPRKEKSL